MESKAKIQKWWAYRQLGTNNRAPLGSLQRKLCRAFDALPGILGRALESSRTGRCTTRGLGVSMTQRVKEAEGELSHSSPWGGRVQDSKEKGGLFQAHWQEACLIPYYRHFAAQLLWWLGKNNISPLRGSNSWKNGYQLKQIDTWYNRPDFYRHIKNLGIPWQHLKRYKCSTQKIFLELETTII